MTKRERENIGKAIALLSAEEEDYHAAMEILYDLIGVDYPVARALRSGKAVTVQEIAARANSGQLTGRKE